MALYLCVALSPLVFYFAWIGYLGMRTRAYVINGARDGILLGLGLSGLGIAGPLELFLPEAAAFRFGSWVWALLGVLYFLLIALVVVLQLPRITIYNATADVVRPIVATVSRHLDPQARWVVDCLILPKLGVRLHLIHHPAMRTVQLQATGNEQDLDGWKKLEGALRRGLADVKTTRSPRGWQFMAIASLLLLVVIVAAVRDHETIAKDFQEFLRL